MRPAGHSSSAQKRYLTVALERVRLAFSQEVEGVWAEILPLLVAFEWERAVAGLSTASLRNTNSSIQAWMQVWFAL